MSANIIDIPIVVTNHDHESGRARERDQNYYKHSVVSRKDSPGKSEGGERWESGRDHRPAGAELPGVLHHSQQPAEPPAGGRQPGGCLRGGRRPDSSEAAAEHLQAFSLRVSPCWGPGLSEEPGQTTHPPRARGPPVLGAQNCRFPVHHCCVQVGKDKEDTVRH